MSIGSIKDGMLEKFIHWKVRKLNEGINWDRLADDIGADPTTERSIVAYITDKDDKVHSFLYGNYRLEWIKHPVENPTIVMRCNEQTFRAILAGRIGPDEAFYGGLAEFTGKESLLREKIIANLLFSTFFTEEGFERYKADSYEIPEVIASSEEETE
jgi:putative sterol carrier protein